MTFIETVCQMAPTPDQLEHNRNSGYVENLQKNRKNLFHINKNEKKTTGSPKNKSVAICVLGYMCFLENEVVAYCPFSTNSTHSTTEGLLECRDCMLCTFNLKIACFSCNVKKVLKCTPQKTFLENSVQLGRISTISFTCGYKIIKNAGIVFLVFSFQDDVI